MRMKFMARKVIENLIYAVNFRRVLSFVVVVRSSAPPANKQRSLLRS